MRKNRLCWCGIVIAALLLYLFDNETVTLAVLIAAIAIPVLSGLSLALCKIPPQLRFETGQAEDGYMLAVTNPNVLPLGQVQAHVNARNLRTAAGEDRQLAVSVPGRKTVRTEAGHLKHVGRYEMRAENVRCVDPLGLFARAFPAVTAHAEETVYPDVFPLHLTVRSSAAVLLESDLYADHRAGNDPGEVHSIREYVPGDPIRNMHWKLSEKTDKLLVKELGMPVTDQLLVLLDTSNRGRIPEAGSDAIAAVYGSVLQALLADGMDFSAGWPGSSGGTIVRKITSERDLADAMQQWLAATPDAMGVLEGLDTSAAENRFEHLVIACGELPSGLDQISGGALVTVLCYGQPAAGNALSADACVGFDEHSMKIQLQGLEV